MLYAIFYNKFFYLIWHEDLFYVSIYWFRLLFFTSLFYTIIYNHFSIGDYHFFFYFRLFLEVELGNQT